VFGVGGGGAPLLEPPLLELLLELLELLLVEPPLLLPPPTPLLPPPHPPSAFMHMRSFTTPSTVSGASPVPSVGAPPHHTSAGTTASTPIFNATLLWVIAFLMADVQLQRPNHARRREKRGRLRGSSAACASPSRTVRNATRLSRKRSRRAVVRRAGAGDRPGHPKNRPGHPPLARTAGKGAVSSWHVPC
jgi:hypothetical protein